MIQLVILRHGEITGSHNTYLGITNAHLSKRGQEQAAETATQLSKHAFDAIYCSPLYRCQEMLEKLNRPEKVTLDERIQEINFGLWEGKTFSEINEQYPEYVSKWAQGDSDFCFPEGEQISDFHSRVSNFAHQLYALKSRRILIVSHGGVIRHLICALLNISFDNYLYFKIDYGRFVLIDLHSEGGVLTGLNRRCIDG
jgi:alpha-ribazole phosphatase